MMQPQGYPQQVQMMQPPMPQAGRVLNEQEKYMQQVHDQNTNMAYVNKNDRYLQEVREQNGDYTVQNVQIGVAPDGTPIYQQQKVFTAVQPNMNAGLVSEHAKESGKITEKVPENVVCFACQNSMMTITELQVSCCQIMVCCLCPIIGPCVIMSEEYKDVLHKCSLCGTDLKLIKY